MLNDLVFASQLLFVILTFLQSKSNFTNWYLFWLADFNSVQRKFIFTSGDLLSSVKIYSETRNFILPNPVSLTLSWRRSLWNRNQSIGLQNKSINWFLYHKNLCHERVNVQLPVAISVLSNASIGFLKKRN